MSNPASQLIDAYLDETISAEGLNTLEAWIVASPENAGEFVRAVSLHDRLRGDLLARAEYPVPAINTDVLAIRRPVCWTAWIATALVAGVLCLTIWNGLGTSAATAAVVELNRIIEVNAVAADRTWRIAVEGISEPRTRRGVRTEADEQRPPKPPLDGAKLYVRRGGQFVLIRKSTEGGPFLTGSDGLTSWAVKPDGSLRISADLTEFKRDLPGHEEGLPLINLDDGLARLRAAYDVQVRSVPEFAGPTSADRLLVGVKRRGYRGPERVEIAYSARSGQIRELRFVEMPYGPDRLTIRLRLESERDLGPAFFGHAAHHAADRKVEVEN